MFRNLNKAKENQQVETLDTFHCSSEKSITKLKPNSQGATIATIKHISSEDGMDEIVQSCHLKGPSREKWEQQIFCNSTDGILPDLKRLQMYLFSKW